MMEEDPILEEHSTFSVSVTGLCTVTEERHGCVTMSALLRTSFLFLLSILAKSQEYNSLQVANLYISLTVKVNPSIELRECSTNMTFLSQVFVVSSQTFKMIELINVYSLRPVHP